MNKLPGERNPEEFTIRELEIQVQTGGPRLGLWKGTGPILMSSCCHPKRFVVEFSRNSAGIQQELSRNSAGTQQEFSRNSAGPRMRIGPVPFKSPRLGPPV